MEKKRMAYFIILAEDHIDAHDKRMEHRQKHIDYWTGESGVVKVAGAILDDDRPFGSGFLLEADDEASARALVAADPFTKYGIFSGTMQVIAMRPAIGDWLPKT